MKVPVRRCALYTRKSTDEGLDQAFNSLDAQREACAAYVQSQSGEGWKALPAQYDDGGYSGGTMERPGLLRLMDAIRAGRVDIVVVYKIDRLTRSLADFARMVEVFEANDVSFVSVTQAFNTTSSMGRLTLNVLLSFAQFEREVTGERIRDKIAASKKKGMWMGGTVPLGYDLPAAGTHRLQVNEGEADKVRHIYRTYLQLGSVYELERQLVREGIRSKHYVSRRGQVTGGQPFSRGALFHLLRNRTYLGESTHGERSHPGLHDAIIDGATFENVQARLDANAMRRRATRTKVAQSPLAGRIRDADGQTMSPTFAYGKSGRLYRYYVSAPLQQGGKREEDDPSPRRVSATAIETALAQALTRLLPRIAREEPLNLIYGIEVRADGVLLWLPVIHLTDLLLHLQTGEAAEPDPADPSRARLTLPLRFRIRGGKTSITGGEPGKARSDPVLIRALREAHLMVGTGNSDAPMLTAAPATPHRRRLVRLAFLAPEIQRAIVEGSQPPGLSLARLLDCELPLTWEDQKRVLGFAAQAQATCYC